MSVSNKICPRSSNLNVHSSKEIIELYTYLFRKTHRNICDLPTDSKLTKWTTTSVHNE